MKLNPLMPVHGENVGLSRTFIHPQYCYPQKPNIPFRTARTETFSIQSVIMMKSLFISIPLLCNTFQLAIAQVDSCSHDKFASVPADVNGPPVSNVTGYRLEDLGKGTYMITDGIYQAMFLVSTDSVIAVDAPPSLGPKMLTAIRSVTSKPVSYLVYSHSHADHIGAANVFGNADNLTIIAHDFTAEELRLVKDNDRRPIPTITFDGNYTLDVCNQTLELSYLGPNHQPGNIFIYAPAAKALMLVDIVFPGWIPFALMGEAQSIPGYIAAHEQLLAYDFQHFIGGHLGRLGNRDDVLTSQSYAQDLYNNCANAILLTALPPNETNPLSASTLLPPVASLNPDNSWAVFDAYLQATSRYCANITNMKWGGKLAGADVFGFSNAYAMVESLRIDYNVLGPFRAT